MSKVLQDYFPRTISQYVPNMEFAADVVQGKWFGSLGSPVALDLDGILDGATIGTTAKTFTANTSPSWNTLFTTHSSTAGLGVGGIDAKYGRALTATGNASTDQVVTITGRDYLGQIMVENITLNGTTPVLGEKAFKYVDSVVTTVGTGGTTLDLGWTNRLGLPYMLDSDILIQMLADGADDLGSSVVVRGVTTDPAVATTDDPRGLVTPNVACDGSVEYVVEYYCNTADLHGVEHFGG